MVLNKKTINWLFIGIAALALTACGSDGPTKVESDLGLDDAPDWVNEGSQALNTDEGRLIHGVGEAANIGNVSLQKNASDNRARAEVASVLGVFIDNVSEDYSSFKGKTSTVDISRVLKTKTKALMSGVHIIARWVDEDTKRVYSLAELDLEQVKKVINGTTAFPANFKNYMQKSGDNVFNNFVNKGQ